MGKYIIAYHGGKQPASKEEGMAQRGKWQEWVASLGEAVVNPGTPLMNTKTITSFGVENETNPDVMNGFAMVKAENIEAAMEIAKSDPFLDMNGTIRVSEMMEMG